ncbi:MAG: hypothetical protein ACYC2Z_07725 [Candidatus Nanopelagicales bacterium]
MIPSTGIAFDEPCQFRLPGFGGAAVFLRALTVPGIEMDDGDEDAHGLALDVMLLTPTYHAWYLRRACDPGFVERLSDWLFRAGDEELPEQTVESLSDEGTGLVLSVVSSDGGHVGIEASVVKDLDDPVTEADAISFETSRLVLVAAAEAVRVLDGSDPYDTDEGYPA